MPRTKLARETTLAIESIGSPNKYGTLKYSPRKEYDRFGRRPRRSEVKPKDSVYNSTSALAIRDPLQSYDDPPDPTVPPRDTFDNTLTVANRHLSRKTNEPISYMRRTTKRPLPCPHCHR